MEAVQTKTKTIAIMVGIFGAAALGYGGYSIMQSIRTPFNSDRISSEELLALIPQTIEQQEQEQRTKDTDGDTLRDYDEINLYGTSPYLTDSDSDGLTDTAEVQSGTDPNCPQGQD